MQEFNTMETDFSLPLQEKGVYQNLNQLMEEGHRLILQLQDGTKIGYAYKCTVSDDEATRDDGMVSMSMAFSLTHKFSGTLMDMMPVVITYKYDDEIQFKVLSHFILIVAPSFRPKF